MRKALFMFVVTLAAARSLPAQEPLPPPGGVADRDDADDGRTPPRLSFTHGEVSFWRPGAEDWTRAQINLPLGPGDALYAGEGANLELQIGPRAFIRAGAGTQLGLENQEPDFLQFKVTSGHVAVDVRDMEAGHTIEINTPNAVFAVEESGYYRVDVTESASAFTARRSGRALVTPADGEVRALAQNEQIVIEGIEAPTFASYAAADLDAWDRWNYERTDRASDTKSARYVPRGVYGTHELDEHGTWDDTSDYGAVWTPRHVAADWAPYSDGRWVFDVSFGWTWVDNAPWGWAPSHYGRWVRVRNRWGWAPGPVVVASVYAPAVVAFFGSGNVRVSIGVSAPAVGWVALGWGEPVVPWWGHHDYVGVPSWRGWGGPRVVNRTVINNTTIVNVNNINVYENAQVRNAVVAERQDRFGRGDYRHARVRSAELERLQPVRGNLDVRPVSASLSPRREKGVRPPDEVLRRSVVATRQPRNPENALRAQGINVPDTKPMSAPRIVRSSRPGREGAAQAPREQAAPQSAPREQAAPQPASPQRQDARQPAQSQPRVGRMREVPRKDNQGNRPPEASAPLPPGAAARQPIQEPGVKPPVPARQARPQREDQPQRAAPGVQQPAAQPPPQQARPQREQQPRQQAAPRVQQPAAQPPPQQARPQREQQPRQQAAPRVQQPAAQPPPQQARPQREQQPRQQAAPRVQQPAAQPPPQQARPRREEQQRQQAAPRVQQPAAQPRPQQARPQQENRPQRAERKQEPPAAAAPPQRPPSAGDAPAKRNAPGSGSKRDQEK